MNIQVVKFMFSSALPSTAPVNHSPFIHNLMQVAFMTPRNTLRLIVPVNKSNWGRNAFSLALNGLILTCNVETIAVYKLCCAMSVRSADCIYNTGVERVITCFSQTN